MYVHMYQYVHNVPSEECVCVCVFYCPLKFENKDFEWVSLLYP